MRVSAFAKHVNSDLADEPMPAQGAMEGDGAYNRHAKLQASGVATALRLLEEAAGKVELGPAGQPLVIADYGSSQGRNSLAPMRAAIRILRARAGTERPICTYHVDLPANDFNSLFSLLDGDPERYILDEPNVFPCAIGRSFYEKVLPAEQVNLGWSSYAAVWLSRIPARIPGHFIGLRGDDSVRAAFDRQGAEDWEAFLALRAAELRAGGHLVVVLPGLDDDGVTGFEGLFDQANEAIAEMVGEGAITNKERAQIVLGAYPRRKRHLLAPFENGGQFRGLRVEHYEISMLSNPAWVDYQQDGNKESLAARNASFFRATFLPSLTAALERACEAEGYRKFADHLEQVLKRRLEREPVAVNSRVQTIVLAKRSC
jgi:hypothetical protein